MAKLAIEGCLTALVTPFKGSAVDFDQLARLVDWQIEQGVDGLVAVGTTGESATLDVDEHVAVIASMVKAAKGRVPVVAGAGGNATAEALALTKASEDAGADALLHVTPYYNRPNRRGIIAHYREVVRAADRPILLYNIPQRTGSDLPNDLLAELAQLDHISGVKQANNDNLALVDGLELYAGNDDILGRTLDLGGAGGILVASHVVGPELRRMVDEPDERAAIDAGLKDILAALGVGPAAMTTKAALNLLGHRAGIPRLPYVEADPSEISVIRSALAAHGLLEPASA